MSQRTPDAWIERQPEDDGPQDEDRCPVCNRVDCDCQADSEEQSPRGRVFSSHAQDRLPSIRKLKEAVATGGAQ